jgi:2-polyprenyl-6-methoxyphenol hydroxylase-like FAD-dependent oxidoreductase
LRPFKILFHSGGGVGGLTLAFALTKSPNIRVDVYEAANKFTEIGAGIGIWWRTRQVLKALGLEEDVVRLLTFRPGEDRGKPDPREIISDTDDPCSAIYTISQGRPARRPCHGGNVLERFDPQCLLCPRLRLLNLFFDVQAD